MAYEILHLWPIPIYKRNIGLKSEWEEVVESFEWKKMKSGTGQLTKTLSLLEDERLAELKNLVLSAAHEYTRHHYGILNKFKIVSSWALKTMPEEVAGFGEFHNHGNCVMSASYYFDRTPESGGISFKRNATMNPLLAPNFEFEIGEDKPENLDAIRVEPEPGDILFFPSYLEHRPELNMSDKKRLSMGCNFFPDGLSYWS
tara:strand:+ start:138 stop:740 length:603 start_codon:yes stop_codon:yes gene_type:complete